MFVERSKDSVYRKVVVISGLTAAGKTTHGKLLAEAMGMPYFSASDALRALVSKEHGVSDAWGERWHPGVDTVRNDGDVDRQVDRMMLEVVQRSDHGLFDACFLPWLYDGSDVINIWLESDLESRIRKCYVSHLDNARISIGEARDVVERKDQVTRKALLRTQNSVYRPDGRFDAVLCNSDLMQSATVASAVRGVAVFSKLLEECVYYLLGMNAGRPNHERILFLRDRSNADG